MIDSGLPSRRSSSSGSRRLQGIAAIPRSFPPEGRASICAVARRSPDISCDRMAQLAQDPRLLLEEAVDAGDRER